MAHPFIACDFEMWNDMKFRYKVLQYFLQERWSDLEKKRIG